MSTDPRVEVLGGFGRPGKALRVALLLVFAVWLTLAVAINWGGASGDLFLLLCGNTRRILGGEVWRLLTAPLLHHPGSLGSILFTLLGLYFLSPSLESAWGSKRFAWFLVISAVAGYSLQICLGLILPASVGSKLVPEYWFGATPVIEAIAIAWALSFKGQTVRLMLLVPVSSTVLVAFVVVSSLLAVVALSDLPSGLLAPFGGMLVGWLLGGGTPSPARRAWLRLRLARAERSVDRERRRRIAASGLRLVPSDEKDDDRGPDGHLLN